MTRPSLGNASPQIKSIGYMEEFELSDGLECIGYHVIKEHLNLNFHSPSFFLKDKTDTNIYIYITLYIFTRSIHMMTEIKQVIGRMNWYLKCSIIRFRIYLEEDYSIVK